jgi:hypothetical protein
MANEGSFLFDERAFATALVEKLKAAWPDLLAKLDGSTFTITHPALKEPVTITYEKKP